MANKTNKPEIILFDLETLPNPDEAVKVWPRLSDYPGKTLKASITSGICAGYKYLGEKTVHCINAWDFPEWKKDVNNDKKLFKALYEILKNADLIVTHNGIRFDWKYFQTRLMINELPTLHQIPHVDTCQLSKSHLYLFDNKLDTLGEFIAGDRKMKHEGWDLWVKTRQRNEKAMAKMTKYCKQDVRLLEKVFYKLRPFATNIPNHNLWIDEESKVCPNCGSDHLRSNGLRHTKTKSYRRLICGDCNSHCRLNLKGKDARSIL